MARFLLINRCRAGEGPAEGTAAHDEEMREWGLFNRAVRDSGELLWSLALDDPGGAVAHGVDPDGHPARVAGRQAAAEGVFALYLVDVFDSAGAEEWARRMPTARYGTVEVRAVLDDQAR